MLLSASHCWHFSGHTLQVLRPAEHYLEHGDSSLSRWPCLHQCAAVALQIAMKCRGKHCRCFCRNASKESVPTEHRHVTFHLELAHSLSPMTVGATALVEEARPLRCGLWCCFLEGAVFIIHTFFCLHACVLFGVCGEVPQWVKWLPQCERHKGPPLRKHVQLLRSCTRELTSVVALPQLQLWQGFQPNSTWEAHCCRGTILQPDAVWGRALRWQACGGACCKVPGSHTALEAAASEWQCRAACSQSCATGSSCCP